MTAEYAMLPRSTHPRAPRGRPGRVGGRTHEIQRLIGRSLRAVTRLDILGERTLTVDCDVIQADGGTRCAAITGAYVALRQAFGKLLAAGDTWRPRPSAAPSPPSSPALSDGVPLLDLSYQEDSRAEVDFNVVMTATGEFVESQGTGRKLILHAGDDGRTAGPARRGIRELLGVQALALTPWTNWQSNPQAYSPSQAPPMTCTCP